MPERLFDTPSAAPTDDGVNTSRPSSALSVWWRLTRGGNLILAGAAAWVGAVLATTKLWAVAWPAVILAPILIAAAGNIDNDCSDHAIDAANDDDRPLVTGSVTLATARSVSRALFALGLLAAVLSGWRSFALAATVMFLLLLYNRRLSSMPLSGNIIIALLGAAPILYGAISTTPTAYSNWMAAALGGIVAFWLHLAREILKDILDADGDARVGRRTLAIALGRNAAVRVAGLIMLIAAVSAFVVGIGDWFGPLYLFGVIVTIAPALLLGAAQCGFNPSSAVASRWTAGLKLCMAAGLAWLVLGRLPR